MKFSIIGSGEIGTALVRAFARKKIEVAIANSRGPATLASLAEELGPDVVPQSVQDACQAEMIFLAVPFSAHRDVAKQFGQWNGRIVVDVTNAFHVAAAELGSLLSSEIVSQAFVGARLVKAFNHLPRARNESLREGAAAGRVRIEQRRRCQLSCIDRSNPAWVCSSRTRSAR